MNEGLVDFERELTSVWSFPERGKWKTHSPVYRGNFAPQIPRNLILQYSKEGDVILDPMMGGGTTLIEAKLLNRKSIGYDINPEAVQLTRKNLNFEGGYIYEPEIGVQDVRNLSLLKDQSVDLIVTHPPYLNIIKYSDGNITEDLSNIHGVKKFLSEFSKAIGEFLRVLKDNSYCAVLIGDTRRACHYIPLSYYVMRKFLEAGFILKEDIIKVQHNCSSTSYWKKQINKYNFFMIMHEHLFVFRKPLKEEDLSRMRYSTYFDC